MNIGHICIILCHCYIVCVEVFSFKTVKLGVNQSSGDFSCTVRTEVCKYNTVASTDCTCGLAVCENNCRNYEFICNFLFVGCFNCFIGACAGFANTLYKSIICFGNSFPTVVSVHCIVSAGNCGNFAHTDFLQCFVQVGYKVSTACRGYVSSIHKAVYIYLFKTFSLGKFYNCCNVVNVGVNTTV